jgi:hypothetical protein
LNARSEELANEHDGQVTLSRIGKSRSGEEIKALKIGNGKRTAFLYGFPHPNEPIGSMTLEFLSRSLVENPSLRELDYTWYIVKCIDPDGARLNEGWFKGSLTPMKYALGYYRSPVNEQVEWTFPVKYKTLVWENPMPETKAMMNLIDTVKPSFMYSLHNCGFGGVYFFMTRSCEPLYPVFQEVVKSEGLPIHQGEPESPYMRKYSTGVFQSPIVSQEYEYLSESTEDDPAKAIASGCSGSEYAARTADTFTLICEMPLFYDPRIEDSSPSDITRREASMHDAERTERMLDFTSTVYSSAHERIVRHGGRKPFMDSIEFRLRYLPEQIRAQRHHANRNEEMARKATVAEKFDCYTSMRFYDVLHLGMLYRAIVGTGDEKAESEVLEFIKSTLGDLTREASFKTIPIKKLIRVQLASALMTVHHLSCCKWTTNETTQRT